METESREQLPMFEYRGLKLRINFNEEVVSNTPEDAEPYTSYKYLTAVVDKTSTYNERVEAIIATKYPTYGAELSAKNKSVQSEYEHDKHVKLAKHLAANSLSGTYEPFVYVPNQLSARQIRLVLSEAGLLSQVEAEINAMPSPQKEAAVIEWSNSTYIQRDHPLVLDLAGLLGLTSDQVDQMFIQGITL